jgi:hypothetical protein
MVNGMKGVSQGGGITGIDLIRFPGNRPRGYPLGWGASRRFQIPLTFFFAFRKIPKGPFTMLLDAIQNAVAALYSTFGRKPIQGYG